MAKNKKETASGVRLKEIKELKIIVNSPNYYIWDGFRFAKA